jgi:hypothetical protein
VAGHLLIFNYFLNLGWGHFGKKKKVRMIELKQFESLGGGVKCHFLNIEVKSSNEWIVQRVKYIFS